MDIAMYKCIVDERMEKIKNETYGKKSYSYYKNKQTMNWKRSMNMILKIFI